MGSLSSQDIFPFLSFPVELRLKTYGYYLQRSIIRIPGPPIPNTLSLLLTCRTIYEEACPQVLSTVTFSLWSSKDLIHFLGCLSKDQIRSLRHIAVCGSTIALSVDYPENTMPRPLPFFRFFGWFPDLQLDTITIRDGYTGPVFEELGWGDIAAFHEMGELVSHGTGWRELRYLSPNKIVLNKNATNQPRAWDDTMKKRDGEESGTDVRILVAKELVPYTPLGGFTTAQAGFRGESTPWTPPEWEYVDEDFPWREEEFYEFTRENVLPPCPTGEPYEQRPIVVVVRRGEDVNVRVLDEVLDLTIRSLLERISWKEMKERGLLQGWKWTRNSIPVTN